MKRFLYMMSFLLLGILMPIAIWVAAGAALFSKRPSRRAEQPVYQV